MSSYWGSRQVTAVTSTGNATQLFPSSCAAGADTTAATGHYPPTGGGAVRRATGGSLEQLSIVPDGTNGGTVEIWDVAGLDRGDTNNVNTGTAITDAYLTANGRKIAEYNVIATQPGTIGPAFQVERLEFNQGLAVRFVASTGYVKVAPFVNAGFMKTFVAG